jgi:hypothetical protein
MELALKGCEFEEKEISIQGWDMYFWGVKAK